MASDLVTTARLPALDMAGPSEEAAGREISTWALEPGGEDFNTWVSLKSQFSPL